MAIWLKGNFFVFRMSCFHIVLHFLYCILALHFLGSVLALQFLGSILALHFLVFLYSDSPFDWDIIFFSLCSVSSVFSSGFRYLRFFYC